MRDDLIQSVQALSVLDFWSSIPLHSAEAYALGRLEPIGTLAAEIEIEDRHYKLSISKQAPENFNATEVAEIWFENRVCEVFFPAGTLARVVHQKSTSLALMPDDNDLKAILFEHGCETFLAPVEKVFNAKAVVLNYEIQVNTVWDTPLFLSIQAENQDELVIAIDSTDLCSAKLIESFFPVVRERKLPKNLVFELAVYSDTIRTPFSALKALEPRGGVFLPKDWRPNRSCRLVANRQFSAPLSVGESGECVIVSGWKAINQPPVTTNGEDVMTISADDLELDISIELARTKVKLDELSELDEGSIVPFNVVPQDDVYLVSEGKYLAKGTLVNINGRFAVQITQKYT